jgi:hypothetical protein
MGWKTVIKLVIIILFSVHMCYNFSEHFTPTPIDWRYTSQDNTNKEEEEEEGPKREEKYLKLAEDGYGAGKYDIQYHEPVELIEEKNKANFNYDYIKVSNNKQNDQVKRLRVQSKILYKDPVNYKYGITPYVPSYTDTVILASLRKKNVDFSKIQ